MTQIVPILLQTIEKELLERLKNGVYADLHKDILNIPFDKYRKVLEWEEQEEEVFMCCLIYAFLE